MVEKVATVCSRGISFNSAYQWRRVVADGLGTDDADVTTDNYRRAVYCQKKEKELSMSCPVLSTRVKPRNIYSKIRGYPGFILGLSSHILSILFWFLVCIANVSNCKPAWPPLGATEKCEQ